MKNPLSGSSRDWGGGFSCSCSTPLADLVRTTSYPFSPAGMPRSRGSSLRCAGLHISNSALVTAKGVGTSAHPSLVRTAFHLRECFEEGMRIGLHTSARGTY